MIADPEFRRRLDTVARQSDKNSIIRKYEIGLSRYLILAGYHVATFVDGVLPFHPVYRESAFDLLSEGFPFSSGSSCTRTPFTWPDLHHWKERVLAAAPDADVDAIERNLWRVSPSFNLHRALSVTWWPGLAHAIEELIVSDNFDELERFMPRFDHWWAFPVESAHRPARRTRPIAVFEAVRHDPTIKKVLIGPTENPGIGGANVAAVLIESQGAQWYLLRAGAAFVTEGPRADLPHPISAPASTGSSTSVTRRRCGPSGRAWSDGTSAEAQLRRNAASPRARPHPCRRARRPRLRRRRCDRARGPPPSPRSGSPAPREPTCCSARRARSLRTCGPSSTSCVVPARDDVSWCGPRSTGVTGSIPELSPEQLRWLHAAARERDAVVGVRPPRRDLPSRPVLGLDPPTLRAAGLLVLSHRVLPDTEMVLREAAALHLGLHRRPDRLPRAGPAAGRRSSPTWRRTARIPAWFTTSAS